jgi:hypothetical protein
MSALRRTLLFVVAICALALPAAAVAADSSVQGYGGPGGSVESSVGSDPGSSTSTAPALSTPTATKAGARSSNLPFTGLDVGSVAAVGFGLLLMGVGLSLVLRGHRHAPALATATASGRGQPLPPLARANDGDAALIVAMEMMLDGNTRDEVSGYLRQVFRIENSDAVADEAFRRAQVRKRSALAMNVPLRRGPK